ncbi:MAG: hypothetical protein NC313_03100 [Butyrivibrio sp.]|nr:hypothetical protein [Butyrivibrio sp.]
MAADIILDDWTFPISIDVIRNNKTEYDIEKEELDRNIQQNHETIRRIRNNKKYKNILQEV